jgi:DNA-binding MarR family transcriptional regulator
VNTPSSLVNPPPADSPPVITPETAVPLTPAPDGESGPSQGEKRIAHQKAFLLDQLLQAVPNHRLSRAAANKKLGATIRKHLGLDPATANRLRDQLVAQGYMRVTKQGRAVSLELTDEGREYLQTLEPHPLPAPRKGKPINPNVLPYVKPYLLLRLLRAEGHMQTKGEANKFDALGKRHLVLTATNVQPLRVEMAREGLVEILPQPRTERYRLTPAGVAFLASNEQYPAYKYSIKGDAFNALLRAAREIGTSRGQSTPKSAPRPADLPEALLAELEELRREEYGHTGLVPIYRVRERITARYGPETARHDVLDEAILQLGSAGRVRLISLADLQDATPEQLNASVPGVNETLFYMEHARG